MYKIFDNTSGLWYKGSGKWVNEEKKAKIYKQKNHATRAINYFLEQVLYWKTDNILKYKNIVIKEYSITYVSEDKYILRLNDDAE